MARLDQYRTWIKQVLQEVADYKPSYGEVDVQLHFDEERDHYLLMHAGWNGLKRVYGTIIHIDIINEKIWIQHDGTEIGIASKLVELGVPQEGIVLAFHAPYKRQYTGFAVA